MTSNAYRLDLEGRQIKAVGPLSFLRLLYNIPGARRADGAVWLPLTRENLMAVEAVGVAEVSEQFAQVRRSRFRPTREQLEDALTALNRLGAPSPLLLHQWEFLAHGLQSQGMLNASEQGLGKTRMAIALTQAWGARRVLLCMPKDLARQWEEDLRAIWQEGGPAARFVNLTAGTKVERGARLRLLAPLKGDAALDRTFRRVTYVAVNYEVVRDLYRDCAAFAPDCIVADESWKVKNPTAKSTKALLRLADLMRDRYQEEFHALALSGTPVGNDIGDLWAQLRLLGPDAVDGLTYAGFLERFAVLKPLDLGARVVRVPDGIKDPAGLMRLVQRSWFRATKASCLNLPPKRHQTVNLTLPRDVRRLYDDVSTRGEIALGHGLALTGEAVKLVRLQQIAGGTRVRWVGGDLVADGDGASWATELTERLENIRATGNNWIVERLPSPKLEWLVDWVEQELAPHPTVRVIVWCRFNCEVARITEELVRLLGQGRVEAVTGGQGGVSVDRLDAIKASFNSRNPEGVQVIVAQVKKLFAGHNLQACDYNIDYSLDWSYIVNAQKEDRSHRLGRTEEVNYIRLTCQNTVDEAVAQSVDAKEANAQRTVQNTATDTGVRGPVTSERP